MAYRYYTSPVTVDRRRWAILALLFFSITINLLDRQVLSLVAPMLRDRFQLSNTQYSYIVTAFLLGLTLSQVPAGILIDRWGARWGLPLLLLWWSAANALHAAASSVGSFSLFRFLLGMGESGNYSAGVKVIAERFPARERALAGGIFNTGSVVGALMAPPVIVWIATRHNWQLAFLLPSVLGLAWIVPWLLVYRGQPAAPGETQPAFAPLLRIRQVWGFLLVRALGGPVNHFYWYWLPEYLRRERGFSMDQIGVWAGLPFFFAGLGNVAGGWLSSFLLRRGATPDRARKTAFCAGLACCLASAGVPGAPSGAAALALISVASFGIGVYPATWIGAATDVFPRQVAARVAGLAGLGEGIVNIVLTLATGVVVDRYSYYPVFAGAALLPALAVAALFVVVRRVEPVRV